MNTKSRLNYATTLLPIISTIVLLSFLFGTLFSFSAYALDSKIQFLNQREDAQTQINQLQGTITSIVKKFTDSKSQKTKLSEQVSDIKSQIDSIEKVILDAKVLEGQIQLKIQAGKAEYNKLEIDLRSILRSIQTKQAVSPLQSFLKAKTMGDALSEMYTYYALENKTTKLTQDLKDNLEALDQDLSDKKQLEKNLSQNKLVLKAKESDLKVLLDQTQNDEDKYAELLTSLSNQKNQLNSELSTAQEGYLSHIQDFSLDEVIVKNQGYNAFCDFEEKTPLKVPENYFSRPVENSFVSGGFECDHDGLDIAAESGSQIRAIADGTIEKVGSEVNSCVGFSCNGGYGNYVVIKHILPFGETVYSLYGHMERQSKLQVGDSVDRGSLVGAMGCTGYTTPYPCGVHLHLMIFSDSYKSTGFGCRLGKSKCYNPSKYIN